MTGTVHHAEGLVKNKDDARHLKSVESFSGDLPYGTDDPDTDLWCDVDGRIYQGDGGLRLRALHVWDRLSSKVAAA